MSKKYSINKTTNTLVFTDSPRTLTEYCIRKSDKNTFPSVHIPNSVRSIGASAFRDYNSLAAIHIPNSISVIDINAFDKCHALASVHIPNSAETIRTEAFYKCTSLASVYIPNSVSNIGDEAFYTCSILHKICVPANSKIYVDRGSQSFCRQTTILQPRLKPITALQKKLTFRTSKTSYAIYL